MKEQEAYGAVNLQSIINFHKEHTLDEMYAMIDKFEEAVHKALSDLSEHYENNAHCFMSAGICLEVKLRSGEDVIFNESIGISESDFKKLNKDLEELNKDLKEFR